VNDQAVQVWHVQVERDQESGAIFYRVQVKNAETDPALSKSRETTDLSSIRAMLNGFPHAELTVRAMFGGVSSVTVQKAIDLLLDETGTRAVAKFNCTRAALLASLGLLKLRA
jgi:hypothetical protein